MSLTIFQDNINAMIREMRFVRRTQMTLNDLRAAENENPDVLERYSGFFDTVVSNLSYHQVIVLANIHKPQKDSMTIQRLYNSYYSVPEIRQHYAPIADEIESRYEELSSACQSTIDKIIALRDNYLAHFDKKHFTSISQLLNNNAFDDDAVRLLISKTFLFLNEFYTFDHPKTSSTMVLVPGPAKSMISDLAKFKELEE